MDNMTAAMNAKLIINIHHQTLQLFMSNGIMREYSVSTAKNGPGEQEGSGCTPRGQHVIRAKIGAGCPEGTVLVGRRETGEIYSTELATSNPNRDWILTRILWLSGMEVGKNRLGSVDTMRRYIYIHGCPDDVSFDKPASHGCIRMKNADIVELFDLIPVGAHVDICNSAERLSA
ncbi:MAG: L,D-transpeptidase family protein [Burkholderiaceae bacterium]